MEHEIDHILIKVQGETRLPALSKSFHELISTLSDNDINSQKLGSAIGNHPEITARLIALANSAWSAPANPITNIESACSRLGNSVVKCVCIALSVSSRFYPFRCPEFDLERFWTTSLLVADGVRLLASSLPKGAADDAFVSTAQTAGILHNIGLLWLAEYLPDETGTALRMAADEPLLIVNEALYKCTGTDYCTVGGWLGTQWQFPEILVAALRYHYEINYQGPFWKLTQLLGTAAAMTAATYNNMDFVQENDALERLGLDLTNQMKVYQHLVNNLEKKKELVEILFR